MRNTNVAISKRFSSRGRVFLWLSTWWVLASPCSASLPSDLTELSVEALMRVEVTTVSKKGYQLFETPAAVYVLTREDLARSGIRSLPDALRLVPGLFIAQVDANKWVVTSRGFSGVFSNKLLVLIDGRSVYTPLFSGVFWEAQDVPLSDIDRIEVIRGSGGALWGANAVNGIINIITSSAADTQGGHLQAGWGDEDPGFVTLRYGDRLGDKTYFKIFGKGFRKDPSLAVDRRPLNDGWEVARLGARIDWNGARQSLSLLGDFYTGNVGQTLSITPAPRPPFLEDVSTDADIRGISLLGRNLILLSKPTTTGPNARNLSFKVRFTMPISISSTSLALEPDMRLFGGWDIGSQPTHSMAPIPCLLLPTAEGCICSVVFFRIKSGSPQTRCA